MSFVQGLTASSSYVNEGQTVNFTFTYVNLGMNSASNQSLPYTLSGAITAADISGGALSGTVTTNSNGVGTIPVTLLNDNLTEGPESLTVTVQGVSASTVINDTSRLLPSTLFYGPIGNQESVNEGSNAIFTLANTNIAPGTSIPYVLSGSVNSADILGGALSGSAVVDANGVATFYIPIAADKKTEGAETLILNVTGPSGFLVGSSVTINDTSTTYVNPNDHVTLVEGFGQIKLYQNSDGSQSVLENGVYYPIKNTPYGGDPNGPQSGFIAADFYNGVRVVVYQGGSFWYMNSSWAKDMTGPNSQDTGQVNSAQVSSLFLSNNATPSYALSSPSSVNEGSTATFTLTTTNVASGTSIPYSLSGSINAADVAGGALSGNAIVNASGVATISVTLLNDNLTEGTETLTVTAGGATASTFITDTSKQVTSAPTYGLSAGSTYNEGTTATFTLVTTNVASGTSIPYSLSGGINSADVSGGALSGNAIVDSNGVAFIFVTLLNDNLAEDTELLTVTAGGASASTWINDTSKGTANYSISSANASVDEGSNALFTITASNFTGGGLWIPYTISGINYADVADGALSGSVFVNSNGTTSGTATITIPILADLTTEGAETLTLTAQGKSASMLINDTSKTPVVVPVVTATSSNDTITNLPVSQTIDGGAGIDTLVYNSNSYEVVISKSGASTKVTNPVTGEVDTLINVERIKFADTAIALDTSGIGGQAYRIYQAAFNRTPDVGGLGYWMGQMDSNASLASVANGFVSSAEFKTLYGANPTNAQVVSKFYDNVLHRAPDAGGYSYWLNMLNSGLSVPNALAAFSESPENVSGVSAVIEKGMRYTPYVSPTYSLYAGATSVNEGSVATFTLNVTNVAAGTSVPYTLSGISAADVKGGALSGTAIVSANTMMGYTATISVSVLADSLTEGPETLKVTAGNATASIRINDTSVTLVGVGGGFDSGNGGGDSGGG